MICPNCSHSNRVGAKFCEECGIVLPSSSPGTAAPSASPRPQATAPRRAEPFRPAAPSAQTGGAQPGGAMMQSASGSGDARRTFALIALVLVFVLCGCCGLAALLLYLITQNPSSAALIGIM